MAKDAMKKTALNLAKMGFAGGLIYWLIHSKKITLEPFQMLAKNFWLIPMSLASVLLIFVINNYRWVLLLRGQGIQISQFKALRLSFIGLFFNLAMPGSVGGDVLKAYYVTKSYPKAKVKAVTSVLIDRLAGLYSIILMASVAVLVEWQKISSSQQLHSLAVFVLALVLVFSVFFAFSFSSRVRKHRYTHKTLSKIPAGRFIEKIYDALHSFRSSRKQFVLGIGLSLIAQSQMIYSLYIVAQVLGFDANLESFFFVFPLGFMAVAIPISPAGIGVGQAVFLTLFTWYSGVETSMGPTLITINQVCQALWGLVGAVFYFTNNEKAPKID